MITAIEYRQFARECAKYALEAVKDEDQKSFLELARDWTFAAMAAEAAAAQNQEIVRLAVASPMERIQPRQA